MLIIGFDTRHDFHYYLGWVLQRHPSGCYAYPRIDTSRPSGYWFSTFGQAIDFIDEEVGLE